MQDVLNSVRFLLFYLLLEFEEVTRQLKNSLGRRCRSRIEGLQLDRSERKFLSVVFIAEIGEKKGTNDLDQPCFFFLE